MTLMTPSEAIVETLLAQGVEKVFGIVGSAFMDTLDLFPAAGIDFVSVAHEQGAAHMADGYARASGKIGVCIAQNGPGVTNFVTGVAAAYWAHTPLVVFTPETGSNTQYLGGFQETQQLPFFEPITKYQAHVVHQARIAEFLSRCLITPGWREARRNIISRGIYFTAKENTKSPNRSRLSLPPVARKALPRQVKFCARQNFL